MAKNSGPPPIVYILIFLLLVAGGYWYFFMRKPAVQVNNPTGTTPVAPVAGTAPTPNSNVTAPNSVAPGTTVIRIDGSTSMVTINENLKRGFQGQFPGSTVTTNASGTDKGIQDLVAGKVDLAAISRPLTPQEQTQGIVAQPIAVDSIAIVVGINNPFQAGLNSSQVKDIFEGNITNWSQVGGSAGKIKVINRPAISGTHQTFKELVLGGGNFGTTPNITTLPRDATTPLLQALGNDGIGYATYIQIANQKTVRSVAVNDTTPNSPTYPYKRQLYYAYKNPPSPGVQAFLGYTTSPQGQQMLVGN